MLLGFTVDDLNSKSILIAVIPNWPSSEDELEQGRVAQLSPILTDLDITKESERERRLSTNEFLNMGFCYSTEGLPYSECEETKEDSVNSLMKQSFNNRDQAGSCSGHSEPENNMEGNAQEDSMEVDNDASIPARSYAAVTFAKPIDSDVSLTKGASRTSAKVEEESPMSILQSEKGVNKSEKPETKDRYEHLPSWLSDYSSEDSFDFAPHKNSHCFEAYYGNNGSESDDCSVEALMAYNNICKSSLEGDEKKCLPRDNSSDDPKNIDSIKIESDFKADNSVTSEKMSQKANAENSNGQIFCATREEVNCNELTHRDPTEVDMANDSMITECSEQNLVTPSDAGRVCSKTDLNHSEACNDAAGEQETAAEMYDEHEDPNGHQSFGQYSGEYAHNPYSFDYDGHPYYYGSFITESDQDEPNEEYSDSHDQESGNKGNTMC
ncbi:hypothetical protein TTRE_0000486701 [Trichuris trichiura]|uniref:Uncharacterized protein n=1 Tax=Trichuris trichiura TaxID=36087 RepID=A0A077Z7Z6_TRITR|nr:hypothetical protein TTRE_0000486701 [Trichuris trichiura]